MRRARTCLSRDGLLIASDGSKNLRHALPLISAGFREGASDVEAAVFERIQSTTTRKSRHLFGSAAAPVKASVPGAPPKSTGFSLWSANERKPRKSTVDELVTRLDRFDVDVQESCSRPIETGPPADEGKPEGVPCCARNGLPTTPGHQLRGHAAGRSARELRLWRIFVHGNARKSGHSSEYDTGARCGSGVRTRNRKVIRSTAVPEYRSQIGGANSMHFLRRRRKQTDRSSHLGPMAES